MHANKTKYIKFNLHSLTKYILLDPRNIEDIKNTENKIFFMPFDHIDFSYYKKYEKERNEIKVTCGRWFRSCDEECKKKHDRYYELNLAGIRDYFASFNCERIEKPEYHILNIFGGGGTFVYYRKCDPPPYKD